MLFWFIAIAVTAIACAALFYAAGPRMVNATVPELDDANSHFRLVLSGIDADLAAGKLGEAEAVAAKGELAREILRLKAEAGRAVTSVKDMGRGPLLAGLAGIAAVALGTYALLGNPEMPSQPLAERSDIAAQSVDLETAITRIEAALTANPDDLRGWTVIAPAYMEMGRFADAARAYRRIIALSAPTADLQTSLAEALMLDSGDAGSPEAFELLQAAAASDPAHVLSRLYIAAELTRQEKYPEAIEAWNAVLALSKGDEPWLTAAQQGLAVAQNDGVAPANDQEAEMIGQMVSGLATRLAAQGGTIEDWTQLVRAYLVLGDTAKAQAALDSAVAAYPLTFDRGELDALALSAGLTINGATP
jgi:cytochrome c-type biogenesis protein CcmH